MATAAPIVMPKLGLTMTEGLLASWRVAPGDVVRPGDVLFIVETEKIATEIEAQEEGRIGALVVPEGETVPVGTVVAEWEAQGGPRRPPEEREAAQAPSMPQPVETQAARPAAARIVATPLARRLARQNSVDLPGVAGSGPRGRIKAADVEAFLAAPVRPAAQAAPASAAAAIRRPATVVEKVIARRLSLSKQTIPHFYVLAEADVTQLALLREELNADARSGRLSITHFIVAAVGRALVVMPDCNALWDDDEIVALTKSDVGLAVDSERGLFVPVLRDVGRLSLDGVGRGCADLAARARTGRLAAEELEGGAISVSNIGMFGASHLVPIVNPGQAAILGVAAEKAVFRPDASGAPSLRREIGLTLSCDHRVLDGVRAARFLDHIVDLLAHPLRLLRSPSPDGSQP